MKISSALNIFSIKPPVKSITSTIANKVKVLFSEKPKVDIFQKINNQAVQVEEIKEIKKESPSFFSSVVDFIKSKLGFCSKNETIKAEPKAEIKHVDPKKISNPVEMYTNNKYERIWKYTDENGIQYTEVLSNDGTRTLTYIDKNNRKIKIKTDDYVMHREYTEVETLKNLDTMSFSNLETKYKETYSHSTIKIREKEIIHPNGMKDHYFYEKNGKTTIVTSNEHDFVLGKYVYKKGRLVEETLHNGEYRKYNSKGKVIERKMVHPKFNEQFKYDRNFFGVSAIFNKGNCSHIKYYI